MTEKCVKVEESGQKLCSKLADLNDPQCSALILRHCHVPRLNHLARAIRPYYLKEAAVVHDNITRATYVDIMGFTSLEDDKWSEAVLKIKYGGLGLTSVENTMPAAFVASWAHTVTELPKRFPHIADTINKFVSEVADK